jgi:SNF2 family DNA or RNA helicase
VSGGVTLQAVIGADLGRVVESGFDLETLVSFRWQATLDGEILSEEEINLLADAKRGLVRIRGKFVAADPELLGKVRSRRSSRITAIEALSAALSGSIDVHGERVEVAVSGPLANVVSRLGAGDPAGDDLAPPPGLLAELRPYQRRGVAWLDYMVASGLGGCLADDMGLGKTLQVIALHLKRIVGVDGTTLVICPTSLLANWEREIHRFAPDVAVRRYHGPARHLDDLLAGEIVITSYGVARREAAALDAVGFWLVVADEAQHIKNPASATARALRRITAPARLALTGTPVENRLSDLWAILDWTTPGLLGPLESFLRHVATPIERYRDPAATARLARIVRPFLLRRRKSDPEIAPDLPARTISDVPVALSAEQTQLYEAQVREALDIIETKDGIERQALVLRLLTALKQICNHPAQYLHQAGPLAGRSGKLAALEELVPTIIDEGDAVLVFSQFVECLTLIEVRLRELGIATLFLHGGVPASRRSAMVDDFQAGRVPVFLLSLKAGGVGLNLTRATHVIHFDRWWNPATEDQATDRAHRIGQDRPVQVHRLIAEGTLEDRIGELIERKRGLADAVVGGGEAWIGSLSDAELADLVSLAGTP